ncbi:MAG: GNAT family N-acetyltransferase [Candidatus Azobacteroides sp.]|nr:GNAT family N-acetyltransferase [Candidatus Azobacteroides sp.]
MLEIITADNERKWNDIIRSMYAYDFYHLAFYQQLDLSGKALLLHFRNDTASFALPVIVRKIEGTEWQDITSVYGYVGPLSQNERPTLNDIRLFHETLKDYFDAQRIVSVFSRLHPLWENQEQLLDGLGEVEDMNLTVGIDLDLPESEQKKQYARSLKNRINYLKNKGVTVFKASNQSDVNAFIQIYRENMDRVKATPFYYFPAEYFNAILKKADACIFLAAYKGEVIGGSLCTFCNGIMQAHLNATRNDFLSFSPLKLILDQARKEGIRRKMHCLHLGGGRDGKNDSLFDFKSRFSDIRFRFKAWKYIHNKEIYEALSLEQKRKNSNKDFFPLYRKNS